jgi:hypothetical protein
MRYRAARLPERGNAGERAQTRTRRRRRLSSHSRQIPGDVGRVFPGQLHFSREAEVVANKYLRPGHDAGRERLVMTVAEPEDPAVILIGLRALDLHETEVTQPFVTEAVRLGADDEAIGFQRPLDPGDQFEVRDGRPGICGARRRDMLYVRAFNGPGTAMKQQIRARTLDGWWLMIE